MTTWTPTADARRAIDAANAAVGKGSEYTGMCEKFTRTCYGYPAAYASANDAYLASRAAGGVVSSSGSDAPAGAVFFWDITTGSNAPYDHIAPVVATGVVASTSAGPNRTVARVRIADLTTRWGMKPRGFGFIYHGKTILTKSSGGNTTGGDSDVRAYQERQNTFGDAGLFVDGVRGKYTIDWEDWVDRAQYYLNFYKGVQNQVVRDKDYGPIFHDQVRTVQSRNDLFVDGILGPVMIDWMRSAGSTGMPDRPPTRP